MRAHRLILLLAAIHLSTGCGYHLAGKNRFLPPDIRRIAVVVFENETRRAEIEQRVTEKLLDEFIKRGPYQTQPQREGADAVLEGAVTGYSSSPVTLSPEGKADRIEIVVQARVRLTDTRTGKILWSQEHFIFRGQYASKAESSSLFDREIVAIDQVASDFAATVVTSLLEGF